MESLNPRFEFLVAALLNSHDSPLLEWDGGLINRRAFAAKMLKIATGIRNLFPVRSRVAISLNNPVDHYATLLALWYSEMCPVVIDFSAPTERIRRLLNLSGCTGIIRDFEIPEVESNFRTVIFNEIPQNGMTACVVPTNVLHFITNTSGSSGEPKAVNLSTENLLWNAECSMKAVGISSKDRLFINIPIHTMSSLCHFLSCALSGATLIQSNAFYFGNTLREKLQITQASGFGGAPAHLRKLLGISPDDLPDKLCFVVSSGDVLGNDVSNQLMQFFPKLRICIFYGLTEVSGRFCFLPPELTRHKPSSVGKPLLPMQLTIENGQGASASTMEIGEVIARGPWIMNGYENSTRPLSYNQCFRTGDLGYLDFDGDLHLVGRMDDIFKSGGEKISLVAIEKAIQEILPHLSVIAIAGNNSILGKIPILFYESKRKLTERELSQIKQHLKIKLQRNHIPHQFINVPEFPYLSSGKYDRAHLKNLIRENE